MSTRSTVEKTKAVMSRAARDQAVREWAMADLGGRGFAYLERLGLTLYERIT
ncbi:MAG: hypothetical protein ACJ789_17240 [Thermomicrobiales bacterium]